MTLLKLILVFVRNELCPFLLLFSFYLLEMISSNCDEHYTDRVDALSGTSNKTSMEHIC